jgi:DHA2 family multidrug resistance protein
MSRADSSRYRALITVSATGATLLQSLDQTIANVALPYKQGSFSASSDEITWVLTSYITAAAIMTAPVGWLAVRFGRKPLFICCILGFTIASMLCGVAQSLAQIVAFRLLQGMFSAALVPLSQATLLDIYPAERRGFAMAICPRRPRLLSVYHAPVRGAPAAVAPDLVPKTEPRPGGAMEQDGSMEQDGAVE